MSHPTSIEKRQMDFSVCPVSSLAGNKISVETIEEHSLSIRVFEPLGSGYLQLFDNDFTIPPSHDYVKYASMPKSCSIVKVSFDYQTDFDVTFGVYLLQFNNEKQVGKNSGSATWKQGGEGIHTIEFNAAPGSKTFKLAFQCRAETPGTLIIRNLNIEFLQPEVEDENIDSELIAMIVREFPTTRRWFWSYSMREKMCPNGRFAFIVGALHSGTTILLRILLEHPDIWGEFTESNLFSNGYSEMMILDRLRKWEAAAMKTGKKMVLEKTAHHVDKWRTICEMVPNRKFIFIMRDGRDFVPSWAKMQVERFPMAAQVWIDLTRRFEEMQKGCPGETLLLKLHELQQKPRETLQNVLSFLELQDDEGTLDLLMKYHETPKYFVDSEKYKNEKIEDITDVRGHRQLRTRQTNQPVMQDTSRWKKDFRYEDYPDLHDMLRPWLEKYGYIE